VLGRTVKTETSIFSVNKQPIQNPAARQMAKTQLVRDPCELRVGRGAGTTMLVSERAFGKSRFRKTRPTEEVRMENSKKTAWSLKHLNKYINRTFELVYDLQTRKRPSSIVPGTGAKEGFVSFQQATSNMQAKEKREPLGFRLGLESRKHCKLD
jgi:hypothetical protein